jgi:hypothetical protein
MNKVKLFALAAAGVFVFGSAQAQFSGTYDPANWTFAPSGDGSWSMNAASLLIVGDDSGVGGYTDVYIVAPAAGMVSFDWSYFSIDSGDFDRGGYQVNFADTILANNDGPNFSGNASFAVNAGDTFGFFVWSDDGLFGPGELTITNFSAPVPEPGTFVAVGLGLAGLALARRRRK